MEKYFSPWQHIVILRIQQLFSPQYRMTAFLFLFYLLTASLSFIARCLVTRHDQALYFQLLLTCSSKLANFLVQISCLFFIIRLIQLINRCSSLTFGSNHLFFYSTVLTVSRDPQSQLKLSAGGNYLLSGRTTCGTILHQEEMKLMYNVVFFNRKWNINALNISKMIEKAFSNTPMYIYQDTAQPQL